MPDAEIIVFPDAEAVTVSFLEEQLGARGTTVPVLTVLPPTTPDLYIRVARTGGVARDLVTDSPLVLIECWGEDRAAISALATESRALMLAAARLSDSVTRVVDGSGIVFLPDPDTGALRYQFVVRLDLRGFAI